MTKLEEFQEIFRLHKLQVQLIAEVTEALERLTPKALEKEAEETRLKVVELEMISKELKDKWSEWQRKYPDA